jgi:hypothetical protein
MTKRTEEYYDTLTLLDAVDRRLSNDAPEEIFIVAEGLHNKNAILPERIDRSALSALVTELGTNTVQTALDLIASSFRYVQIEMSEAIITLQHHSKWKRFKDLMRLPKEARSSEEMLNILKEQQEEAQFWEEKPWRK